jgi:hypothetical protein
MLENDHLLLLSGHLQKLHSVAFLPGLRLRSRHLFLKVIDLFNRGI